MDEIVNAKFNELIAAALEARQHVDLSYDLGKAAYDRLGAALQDVREPQEPWGTLEGAERYLEGKDRESFMTLRRETTRIEVYLPPVDPQKFRFIQDLQTFWIGYGEAWGIVQKIVQGETAEARRRYRPTSVG